ncbi:hypothetical protein BXY85_3173 [Roseivirga pacifica]|uniref:Uncharacterized protein n=1 Tax=Roseivirga pacifica TaxID=1267423 RepID=A0A1I0QUI8_9BACT|nr:hypothetical protein [Roseivirga pacifica]RKQ42562.1 hypothetical protein BXY85_3173 [Roseivirga pacifica]SEW30955.1 hypothetical protein SAMN05216290_2702 [Roseivirga pacifica]
MQDNLGFDSKEIQKLKEEIAKAGKNFVVIDSDDNNEEFRNFYFIGVFNGKEAIYDAALYTLRMQHNSEVFDLAQHKVAQKFPQFKAIDYEEDENGDITPLDDLDEEIGLYLTEVMDELEEEETVKVQEHVDIDENIDFGIGLDAGLNVEEITDEVIQKFINDFNEETLKLDTTLYSFQFEEA